MDVVEKITLHYRQNFNTLASKAGRILKDHAFGLDATQEAYEAGLRYSHTFSEDKGEFDKWFNRIYWRTINKYQAFVKGQAPMEQIQEIEVNPQLSAAYLEESGLPAKYREILYHIYVNGYTPKEVARLLPDCSSSVCYKAVYLFRKEVKEKHASIHLRL